MGLEVIRRRWRAAALSGSLAVAVLVAGCGSSSPVPSKLTAQLGRSGTVIQRLEASSQSIVYGLSSGPAHNLNVLAGSLSSNHTDARTASQIAAVLRSPNAPFDNARQAADKVQSLTDEARRAVIPASAYRSASSAVRRFVLDWNAYVGVDADALEQIAVLDGSLLTVQAPLMSFLQSAHDALASGNHAAFESARKAYLSAIKALSHSGSLPDATNFAPAAEAAAAKLSRDESRSADVRQLVEAVRKRYPLSYFAAHAHQAGQAS